MKKSILILTFLFLPLLLKSQVNSRTIGEVGAYGGIGSNSYNSEFKYLPQYPSCCPNYKTGQGFGLNIGILGNYILLDNLSLGVKIGYSDLSGLISQDENKIVDNNLGTKSNGIIRHDLDVTLPSLSFEPTINFGLIENLKGFLGVGFNYLLSGDITQKETLVEPTNVTFENGKATRNEVAGSLDNLTNFLPFVSVGFYYDLPLNNKNDLFLSPTISYKKMFGDVVEGVNWTVSKMSLGVQLRYSIQEKPEIKKEIKRDTIIPKVEPVITSAIAGDFQVKINEEFASDTIFVKYDKDLKFEAILGYVFFEENEAKIPERYDILTAEQAKTFTTDNLKFENSLSGYHNILNILGQRFKKFPNVKINLVGCNSDFGVEQGNMTLSNNRAENIKNYFVNVWGLNPDRFTVTARNLPETPSKTDNEYGRAENRRVEIVPQDWTIFKPQLMSDTTSSTDKNLEVTLLPEIKSKLPLQKWEIQISNNEGIKKSFNGVGKPPEKIEWNPLDDLDKLPSESNPLNFKLSVVDSIGTEETYTGKIIKDENKTSEMSFVQKFVNDAKIEKYNLILFGYNITDLPPVAEVTLNLVKERITDKSQIVSIEGYSDIIGDEDYNLKLSQDRAVTVAKALNVSTDKAIGRGKIKNEIYDNNLPEGRFYSRSVVITLEGKK